MRFTLRYISRIAAAIIALPMLCSCESPDIPHHDVPEGMVEIRPVLPGMYSAIPRTAPAEGSAPHKAYPSDTDTQTDLLDNKLLRLPKGSTIWLIAEHIEGDVITYEKRSYVVYNDEDNEQMSYLIPCTVDDNGEPVNMDGSPLYLKDGLTYNFYAISPARKLDEELLAEGKLGFTVTNGMQFYANDDRYDCTKMKPIEVHADNSESVQVVTLNPMINQTAVLKFQVRKGKGVYDLNIQPSGIQISGLQNDSITAKRPKGIMWHMSQGTDDQPIDLLHGDKLGMLNSYDYTIDSKERVNISVPILPMYCISKPVIVVFRLKINGVPTSYEVMLNEKDFKAGYSYGYRGEVSITDGVTVITWQYVSWEEDLIFPFDQY